VFEDRNIGDDSDSDNPNKQSYSVFDVNKLDLLAHLIRTDITMEETKAGWFQKPEK